MAEPKPWEKAACEIAEALERIYGPISADNTRWIADKIKSCFPADTRPTPDTGIGQGPTVGELEQFKRGIKIGAGMEELAHARAFDAWATASELMSETYAENRRLKKEIEFLRASPSSAPALKQEACGECEGAGIKTIEHKDRNAIEVNPCPTCGGSGKEKGDA